MLTEDVQNLINQAILLMESGEFDKALMIFEDVLKVDPDNVVILGSYAILLVKLERLEEASEYFQKALKIEPNNAVILGSYARLLVILKRLKEANKYFQKALDIEPNNTDVLGNYASLLLKLERLEEAGEYLQKALEIEPNNVVVLGNYASLLVESEKLEEASEYFQKALKIEPNNSSTLRSYISLLLRLKKLEEASQYFEKALEIEPNNVVILRSYASLLVKLERLEEANKCFKKALEIKPNNAVILQSYAILLLKLERLKEASEYFQKALDIDPNNVVILGNYASFLVSLGRLEEASKYFQKALDIDPNNVVILGNYANLLVESGKLKEANKYFQKALEIEPNNVVILGNYASLLVESEKLEEASEYFQKALKVEPNNVGILGNYASFLVKLESLEEACQWFEKALKIEPNDVINLHNYAQTLLKLKNYKEACEYFKQSLAINLDSYIALQYARSLESLKQYQEAINLLKQIDLNQELPYHVNIIRLHLGRLYYRIKSPQAGNKYFEIVLQNVDESDYETILIYSAGSILATSPYNETAKEWLKRIQPDSELYEQAQKMLTLHLNSEEYFNMVNRMIDLDAPVGINNTEMLNQAIYHKIANEISILKSIAYEILYNSQENDGFLKNIIESIESIVEEIKHRRDQQDLDIKIIPNDDYQQILTIISKTAHDISDFVNNELAIIKLDIQDLMDELPKNSDVYSEFEELLTQLEFTEAALNDLKAINEGINIKPHRFKIKELFEKWQTISELNHAKIKLDIQNGEEEFDGDAEKIKSALNELIENSLKHNENQENLEITITSKDIDNPEGTSRLTIPQDQRYLLIEVSDNGEGVPAEKKDWIFQPLNTTSPQGKGSGLGLFIIRKTLVKMNGFIRETGYNGANFEIYLPYNN